jgi:hypothetical protein
MSPTSVSTDRVTKPAQYAAAGIRHCWRLEPVEPALLAYALDGRVYRQTHAFSDRCSLEDPWRVTFTLADLLE